MRFALLCLTVILFQACSKADATSEPVRNSDGRTYYCSTCGSDVAWPPDGHLHGETVFCKDCRVRVPARGHEHRVNRWCDTCGVAAVWTDEVSNWQARGHHHRKTAWCATCRIDASLVPPTEAGGHHHNLTVFCDDDGCQIEVARRMSPVGNGPAEASSAHFHKITTFCPVCRVEAEKDPESGRPSGRHFHFLTEYDNTCSTESAKTGHDHNVTRFCPVCQTEIPIDPGVPTGTLRNGTTLSSTPELLTPEAHAGILAELAEQQKLSGQVQAALAETEAKLGIPSQKLQHTHSAALVDIRGTPSIGDPVSRFRDYPAGTDVPSAEKENYDLRAQISRIVFPSREQIIRSAIKHLEGSPGRTEKQDEDLAYWRAELDKVVAEEQ